MTADQAPCCWRCKAGWCTSSAVSECSAGTPRQIFPSCSPHQSSSSKFWCRVLSASCWGWQRSCFHCVLFLCPPWLWLLEALFCCWPGVISLLLILLLSARCKQWMEVSGNNKRATAIFSCFISFLSWWYLQEALGITSLLLSRSHTSFCDVQNNNT